MKRMLRRTLVRLYRATIGRLTYRLVADDLLVKTQNFSHVTWLGRPTWVSPLDIWLVQETIALVRPELIVECGTNQGGSALFYADLFDLMGSDGRIITVDITRMHDHSHPRIEFLVGSSVDPEIVRHIHERAAQVDGPVLVILDSDHKRDHVAAELEAYHDLVTPGSYMIVQDGAIDTSLLFRKYRPGPLPAARDFLARHPEFEHDRERNETFLISYHPSGWLRRKAA